MRSATALALLLAACSSYTTGGGGAPSTSSASATGGAAPVSTTSSTASGTGGAAGSTNSGGTGGATGSTSSSSTSSSSTSSSSTSSSSTSSTTSNPWGTATLDCAALAGKAHGASSWSTTFATRPPEHALAPLLDVDAGGHLVVAMVWADPTLAATDPTGVEVHRIDPAGIELSQSPGVQTGGQSMFPAWRGALGPGRFAVSGTTEGWGVNATVYFNLATDVFTHREQASSGIGFGYPQFPVAAGTAGDTYVGVVDPNGSAVSVTRLDAAGAKLFSRSLPYPGPYEYNHSQRLEIWPDGAGVLVSGHFDDANGYFQADLGCGPLRPQGSTAYTGEYLGALDAQGNCRWSRSNPDIVRARPAAGGGSFFFGRRASALDLGCGALPAPTTSPGFLGFVDAAGACQWTREAGVMAPTFLPGPGVRIVDGFSGTLDLGCGPLDAGAATSIYLASFDAAGACQYSRDLHASALTVVGAEGPYLWGSYSGPLDLGCGALPAGGGQFVAALDAAGACVFSEALPVASMSAQMLASGALQATAPLDGTVDIGCGPVTASKGMFLAELGPTTSCLWSRAVAAPSVYVYPLSSGDLGLAATNTGTIDLGTGPLSAVGTRDLVVAQLDGVTGQTRWARSFGAPGADLGGAELYGGTGGVMVVHGTVTGTVDPGGGPVGAPYVPVACSTIGTNTCAQGYCPMQSKPNNCCTGLYTCCDSFWKDPAECAPATRFLVALDATGAFLWQRGSTRSVTLDPCGAVIVATHDEPSQLVGSVTVERIVP